MGPVIEPRGILHEDEPDAPPEVVLRGARLARAILAVVGARPLTTTEIMDRLRAAGGVVAYPRAVLATVYRLARDGQLVRHRGKPPRFATAKR